MTSVKHTPYSLCVSDVGPRRVSARLQEKKEAIDRGVEGDTRDMLRGKKRGAPSITDGTMRDVKRRSTFRGDTVASNTMIWLCALPVELIVSIASYCSMKD